MAPITFKRVGYATNGPLELLDGTVDPAALSPNDVLVKVAAAALNPIDLILYHTHWLFSLWNRGTKGIGRDFSGTVEAVGSAVTKFQVGDKISGMLEDFYKPLGTVSQYIVLDTVKNKNVGTVPKTLTMEQSAAFPLVFGTAYTTLIHFKHPSKCTNVLVVGGSTSVGAFVIQLLKRVHNVQTVVSVNSGKSAERVKSYGADIVIDYTKQDVAQTAVSLVKDIGQFDLIVDCVGNSYFYGCMSTILKPKTEGSGYVSINGSSVGDYHSAALQYLNWTNIKLSFFPKPWVFKWSYIEEGTWYEYAKGLFEEGTIEVPIDSVHDLEHWKEAFDTLIDHRAQGKVVIKMQ